MPEKMVDTVRTDATDALSGVISGFTVGAFLQILELEQKTCCLEVQFQDMCGTVYVHRGVVFDAEVDSLSGEEAATLILGWDNATIRVENNCERKIKNIESSLTRLLLDALRRRDETAAANASQNELKSAISLVEGHHFQEAHRRITAYLKAHIKMLSTTLRLTHSIANECSVYLVRRFRRRNPKYTLRIRLNPVTVF